MYLTKNKITSFFIYDIFGHQITYNSVRIEEIILGKLNWGNKIINFCKPKKKKYTTKNIELKAITPKR